jgi:DNA polymerase-1
VKKAFIARPGFTLWEADYAQLELRLGTAVAREPTLTQIFAEGRDVFTEMAEHAHMDRQDVKTRTYSIQYGAGAKRIMNVFGVSEGEARAVISQYYYLYPNFRTITDLAMKVVKTKKKIKLWTGRYRHFRFPKEGAHKAFNAVIQGGAADIMEATMRRLFKEVDGPDCMMLLQVHDSIVWEIRDSEADRVIPEIIKIMEDVDGSTGEVFGVKFAVDCHRWGE